MGRKAVFLDRDGTIIPETGARTADPDIEPLPEAIGAIKKLRTAGFRLAVATNQAAIARGCFTEEDLAVAHEALLEKFAAAGAPLDALGYCPHLPEGNVPEYAVVCDCRKPKPGLLLRLAAEHDIDLEQSYMIGDAERDILAARAAGCKGAVLIAPDPQTVTAADAVAADVGRAADCILQMEARKNG